MEAAEEKFRRILLEILSIASTSPTVNGPPECERLSMIARIAKRNLKDGS